MAIKTALTERFGLEYPIVLAPMGNVSDVVPAAQLVRRIGAEAEACLQHAGELLSDVRRSNDP